METIYSNEGILFEKNGKKYIALNLCLFHDMPDKNKSEEITKQFGLKDVYCSKSVYEIVDEKKLMLAHIKYGI